MLIGRSSSELSVVTIIGNKQMWWRLMNPALPGCSGAYCTSAFLHKDHLRRKAFPDSLDIMQESLTMFSSRFSPSPFCHFGKNA